MPVELKVPEVGESVTEVYIGEWHKAVGDPVEVDEELVELESDKATFDAPSPVTGVLSKIVKQSGESANVGEVIAYIEEGDGRPATKTSGKQKTKEKTETAKKSEQPTQHAAAVADKGEHGDEDVAWVMPSARRLLRKFRLKAADVEATGPGGRLLKEDVLRHVGEIEPAHDEPQRSEQREASEPGEPGRETETIPMSPIRRRIAERLVEAQKNAALLTTFNEIDMTAVNELRRKHKQAFQEKYDVKLGFMSFFVKAAVDALNQIPQLNASVDGTDIVYHNYCDVGIAIGTKKGLVVPVLRNAERMSFAEIEAAIDDLARRGQDGKLSVEELQGGTFTISNGGIYGSLLSTPIVNPPQSGVLGMHAIQDRPVVRDGAIVIKPMMYVALSYDHRIVDGREAVTFLRRIKDALEDPARMLLEV